jgi:molecular chaperone GrpE (heat shock protein)
MLNDNELAETSLKLQDFHLQHAKQQETLAEVLEKYETLIESYKRLKSDYEEERDSRERYKQMARGQERNPVCPSTCGR